MKCLPRPREQDRAHRRVAAERAEGVADRGEHLLVHRVELVRPGELDMGDAALRRSTAIRSLPMLAAPRLRLAP